MDESDLDKRVKQLQKVVADGIAASNFSSTPEGELVIEYINDRVSSLLNKMTASTPMTEREYLDTHGRIAELQMLTVMLQSKPLQVAAAQEELDVIRPDTDTTSA